MNGYAKLSLKKELMDRIQQFITDYPDRGFRSLAQFVEDAVREKADSLRVFELTPRFEHFNLDEGGVKIRDRSIGVVVDISFKPKGILCSHCGDGLCRHVQFALTVPAIQATIRKRRSEGWVLPEV